MSRPWRTAWIVGASTGIGAEIARKLAASDVRVVVSARSADKLDALAAGQPGLVPAVLDVTDAAAVRRVASEVWDTLGGIDLVVLNAGIWQPMGGADYSAAKARQSIEVNYLANAELVEALVPRLRAQGRGHIALTASVAGYRGLPDAAAYAPSKSAVIALAEVLRPDLARFGIIVSVINPGFVDTPMTKVNDFPMPFLMTPEAAADRVIAGLARGRFEIVFPRRMMIAMKLLRMLPYPIFFQIAKAMLPKRGPDRTKLPSN